MKTSFAARIRGVKDKLGKRTERRSDKIDQAHDLRELVKTVSNSKKGRKRKKKIEKRK
jgi:hypothetical protein